VRNLSDDNIYGSFKTIPDSTLHGLARGSCSGIKSGRRKKRN